MTDNLTVSASDFTRFSITAPSDPRLPNGGDYVISSLYNVNPTKFGLSDNYTTFSKNHGKQINHWDGVALNLNARLQNGVIVQGGFDSGKITTDNCEIAEKLPEILFGTGGFAQILATANNNFWTPLEFCHQESPFVTQIKLLGSYTIPKVAVQVSSTFQSPRVPISWPITTRPMRLSRRRLDGTCQETLPTCRSRSSNQVRCTASG